MDWAKVLQMVKAALATSEFWAIIGQAVVETLNTPLPTELKTMTWVYVAWRIISKIAKFMFAPNS